MNVSFGLGDDGILRYHDRLCVPDMDDLRTRILTDAHGSRYSIHPGSTKMYHDLKQNYWWDGMKKELQNMWLSVLIVSRLMQSILSLVVWLRLLRFRHRSWRPLIWNLWLVF